MLLIITGPTASGKTLLAEALSRKLNAEIVSADSRTRYRSLRIGTGRYGLSDDITYHLIDDLDPGEFASSFDWSIKAREAVAGIEKRRKLPVICGGSMHSIQRFIEGMDKAPPPDPELRAVLRGVVERNGQEYLHKVLDEMDPLAASRVHPNNINRVIRYIEKAVCENTVEALPHYNGPYHLLSTMRGREELNKMIRSRTRKMLEDGWVDEVRDLLEEGISQNAPGFTSTGYPHVIAHTQGAMTFDEMERAINKDTVELSRKQLKWIRKHEVDLLDLSGKEDVGPVVDSLSSLLQHVE